MNEKISSCNPHLQHVHACNMRIYQKHTRNSLMNTKSQIEGVTNHRAHNPIKYKSILAIYALISCTVRVTGIIMFFTPTLGLLNLLRHLQAEHVPFLQTYEGTPYFDNSTDAFIKRMNLQRGTWTKNTESDFLGYIAPKVILYTGMQARYY